MGIVRDPFLLTMLVLSMFKLLKMAKTASSFVREVFFPPVMSAAVGF